MSSTHTITLLKPDGTGSYATKPESIGLNLQTQDISTMVCTCDGATDYTTITSAYENGKITYTRNPGASQTLFIGKISKLERWQEGGKGFVRMHCICPKAALDTAVAGQGNSFFISSDTETLTVSNYGLTKDGIPASDEGMTRYYPDHDSTETPDSTSPWIAVSSSDYAPQALVSGALTDVATTIPTQSTTDQGFPPRGILYTDSAGINQELIYYDGYAPDAANSDKYTFYNCVRGVLDTTPAARGDGSQLSGRAVKPVNESEEMTVEGYTGSTWKALHGGLWKFNAELGTVDFNGDLTAAPYSYTDFRYSATHYDVDNAGAETLEGVADDILQYATANGGMGLTKTTDYTVDWPRIWVLDDIGNTRPMYVREVLDMLIENYEPYIWSGSGLGYWFNPTSGKFELDTYEQAGSADVDLSSVKHRKSLQKFNSTAEYSSVLVPYTPIIASLSLLSADRIWHPAIGDTVGGQTMTGLTYMYSDSAQAAGWNLDTVSTGSNNVHGALLVDGNKDTGAGVYFSTNPSADYVFDFWFPDNASYEVGTIVFVVDFRNFVAAGTEAAIALVGWDSYTPGTPPTRGTAKLITTLKVNNGSVAPEAGGSFPIGGPGGGGIIL